MVTTVPFVSQVPLVQGTGPWLVALCGPQPGHLVDGATVLHGLLRGQSGGPAQPPLCVVRLCPQDGVRDGPPAQPRHRQRCPRPARRLLCLATSFGA